MCLPGVISLFLFFLSLSLCLSFSHYVNVNLHIYLVYLYIYMYALYILWCIEPYRWQTMKVSNYPAKFWPGHLLVDIFINLSRFSGKPTHHSAFYSQRTTNHIAKSWRLEQYAVSSSCLLVDIPVLLIKLRLTQLLVPNSRISEFHSGSVLVPFCCLEQTYGAPISDIYTCNVDTHAHKCIYLYRNISVNYLCSLRIETMNHGVKRQAFSQWPSMAVPQAYWENWMGFEDPMHFEYTSYRYISTLSLIMYVCIYI